MYGGIELSVPLRLAVKAFLLCYSKNSWIYYRKSSSISEYCRSYAFWSAYPHKRWHGAHVLAVFGAP